MKHSKLHIEASNESNPTERTSNYLKKTRNIFSFFALLYPDPALNQHWNPCLLYLIWCPRLRWWNWIWRGTGDSPDPGAYRRRSWSVPEFLRRWCSRSVPELLHSGTGPTPGQEGSGSCTGKVTQFSDCEKGFTMILILGFHTSFSFCFTS